jgi:hypothetical protein
MMPSQIWAASMATFSLMKACRVPVYLSRNARSKRAPPDCAGSCERTILPSHFEQRLGHFGKGRLNTAGRDEV